MFDRIWDEHVIADLGDGVALLNVDRHLIHDLVAGPALDELAARGLQVRNPERTFAMPDHGVSSQPNRPHGLDHVALNLLGRMRAGTREAGIRLFDIGEDGQGIVHVVGPELGLTLPGSVIVCGDSHSCTHGGLGALAFGIGTTEVVHVLATQTVRQRRPATMRITYTGTPASNVTAKDIILYTIGKLGTKAGQGCVIEYAGPVVDDFSIEQRLTLCNLSVELGAKIGLVAPDDKTFAYLEGKDYAPEDELFQEAVQYWRTLPSGNDARFDVEHNVDVSGITPQVSWGTSPEHVIPVDGTVPDPSRETDPSRRKSLDEALKYMGLTAGQRLTGTPIDMVFIGSCANGRLSDLREAALVAQYGKVAPNVTAWVVPGSRRVQKQAEAEGLDEIFRNAGFEWREPGCSLCLATSNEHLRPGQRSVSSTNRNFVGRQGVGARTHLASPATAAASALAGTICGSSAVGVRP